MENYILKLKEICQKDLHELTDNDIAFMKARRDYMTKKSLDKYASVLGEAPASVPEDDSEAVLEPSGEANTPESPVIEPQVDENGEELSLSEIRTQARNLGINSFGKSKKTLLAEIADRMEQ